MGARIVVLMLRLARIVVLLALLLVWFLPAQPPPFEVTVTRNVMVAMRDGVKLAADIYQPARNGLAPAPIHLHANQGGVLRIVLFAIIAG